MRTSLPADALSRINISSKAGAGGRWKQNSLRM
jgi:hypothetical protein